MGAARKSHPRFRREGLVPRIEITDDDRAILRTVYRHRFVRADDLYRLFRHRSQDRLSRRLTWLYRNEYLDRPISQIDRFRQGGSQTLVYGLDNAGARLVAAEQGLSFGSADWRARNRSYTRDNLDHTLCVARFMVDLELACRLDERLSLIGFDEILAAAPEATRLLPQPARWPVPVRYHDQAGTVHIAPDAIFGLRALQANGRAARSFVFLEIDRGTMTIAPAKQVRESQAFLHRATILRKLLTYAESYRRELHKEHLGIPAARVLLLTTSAARAEAMRQAANSFVVKPARLPAGLFLFGALGNCEDPLAASFVDALGNAVTLTS